MRTIVAGRLSVIVRSRRSLLARSSSACLRALMSSDIT